MIKTLIFAAPLLLLAPLSAGAAEAPRFDSSFWEHWGDGKAELAGYTLRYNRYGALREGTAITIFVTETFSDVARVKADPGRHPKSDEYPVMKLNLVQDFPTGIYDYNMMTSAFVQLSARNERPAGTLTKVSFSAQEWCGHAYHQLLFDTTGVRETLHSYFDGEADAQRTIDYPANGVAMDALHFWARGLAGPLVKPGGTTSAPMLLSPERARLDHEPVRWLQATLKRDAKTKRVTVPAGTFEVRTARAELDNGLSYSFEVEASFPHRLIAWRSNRGDEALLRGSTRSKYWELNGPGGEAALEALGLSRSGPVSPR